MGSNTINDATFANLDNNELVQVKELEEKLNDQYYLIAYNRKDDETE